MSAKVIIIWDYDTPIAGITSTRPYNYHFENALEELKNVDLILDYAKNYDVAMTFAVVGFGAEKSVFPFDVREQIQRIHAMGHEIASHSWKHEWFPYLTKYQIEKSLARSKKVLEECLQSVDIVKGFVPPHSRPMSWPSRLAFSAGDRALYPFYPGASIGYLLRELKKQNYLWCRTSYRPLWSKLTDWRGTRLEQRLTRGWKVEGGMVYFQGTYDGFDDGAIQLLERAVKASQPIVIVGHPAGLSRTGSENIQFFEKFMKHLSLLKAQGKATTYSVGQYIKEAGLIMK